MLFRSRRTVLTAIWKAPVEGRVAVRGGWNAGSSSERAFLRTIHDSACKRFQTVLSPDYNTAHHDHFHLDMGRGPFCA